jgi:hypothetical protein
MSDPASLSVSSPIPLRPGSHALRWLRRFAAVAWSGSVLAILSLWIQYQSGVYHTHAWLWLPLAAVGLVAGVAALFLGSAKALLGPRRRAMFGWLTIGVVPLLLSAMLVGYMFYEQGQRNLPNTHAHKVGRMAAVTLFEVHTRLRYPQRVESARLVMYHDGRVTDPAGDAAAMDAHVARLEEVLGRRQHSRIHWVRGPALGMGPMCIHSIALGSDASPASWLDRHELAHAFLYQFSVPGAEPPMLLLEGWAMGVDGHPEPLAETALIARNQFNAWRGTSATLRSILRPDLYHVGIAHAYELGGALVDFLLRKYGPEKFLAFYNAIHPDSYESECDRVFGCSWDTLEQEFWTEVERNAKVGKVGR